MFNFPVVLNHALLYTSTSKCVKDEGGRPSPVTYITVLAGETPPCLAYTEHPEIWAYVFQHNIY